MFFESILKTALYKGMLEPMEMQIPEGFKDKPEGVVQGFFFIYKLSAPVKKGFEETLIQEY